MAENVDTDFAFSHSSSQWNIFTIKPNKAISLSYQCHRVKLLPHCTTIFFAFYVLFHCVSVVSCQLALIKSKLLVNVPCHRSYVEATKWNWIKTVTKCWHSKALEEVGDTEQQRSYCEWHFWCFEWNTSDRFLELGLKLTYFDDKSSTHAHTVAL